MAVSGVTLEHLNEHEAVSASVTGRRRVWRRVFGRQDLVWNAAEFLDNAA
jgi:hypothetical protein